MNDIQARWKDLATLASGIVPNTLPLEPTPTDIKELGKDLRLLATRVDALVKAYADHFTQHTGRKVDPRYTDDQLIGALDGNLLFEMQDEAETIQMDMMEAAQ